MVKMGSAYDYQWSRAALLCRTRYRHDSNPYRLRHQVLWQGWVSWLAALSCAQWHKAYKDESHTSADERNLWAVPQNDLARVLSGYVPQKDLSLTEELQSNLDEWLKYYNYDRTHQGKTCCGRTPMEKLIDGKEVWRDTTTQLNNWIGSDKNTYRKLGDCQIKSLSLYFTR